MRSEPQSRRNPTSLGRAVSLALLLVFVDAGLFNQGVIAAITGIVLLVRLPWMLSDKSTATRRIRLRNFAIYMTAVVLVFALNIGNNMIAQRRADALVVAVKAYRAKYQCYPDSLKDLVPEFADSIPVAKYTLWGAFWYAKYEGDRALLFYVAVPPFGRPTYSFARGEWTYLD